MQACTVGSAWGSGSSQFRLWAEWTAHIRMNGLPTLDLFFLYNTSSVMQRDCPVLVLFHLWMVHPGCLSNHTSLSLCSTSTTGSSTLLLRTTMTLSTSSAVLEVLSAWRPWVWCSLTMCYRTWREASRPRSCGSAFPWRWQPSPRE